MSMSQLTLIQPWTASLGHFHLIWANSLSKWLLSFSILSLVFIQKNWLCNSSHEVTCMCPEVNVARESPFGTALDLQPAKC